MRFPAIGATGWAGVGLTLASIALGGLQAPAEVWVALAGLAVICFFRALQLHARDSQGRGKPGEGDQLFSVTMSPFNFGRLQWGDEPRERDPWALYTRLRVVNHSSNSRINVDLELQVLTAWSKTTRLIEPMTTTEASAHFPPPKVEIDFPLALEPEQAVKGTVPFVFHPLKAGEEDVIDEEMIRLVATDHISRRSVEVAPAPHKPGKINHY